MSFPVFWDSSLEYILRCTNSTFGYRKFMSLVTYFQFALQKYNFGGDSLAMCIKILINIPILWSIISLENNQRYMKWFFVKYYHSIITITKTSWPQSKDPKIKKQWSRILISQLLKSYFQKKQVKCQNIAYH